MKKHIQTQKGDALILVLVLMSLLLLAQLPFFDVVMKQMRLVRAQTDREQALQIAEAGINYYQWHLAHFPSDYQDGTGVPGPYLHTYTDVDTQIALGEYSLTITPPSIGSTVVTISSTGWTYKNPAVKRTVTAKYGIPSLAIFSFLSNGVIWIGDSETVGGSMQSRN